MGERYMRATVLSHEVEKSFSVLIFSGVLDRFPQLQIVSAENNIGWLPIICSAWTAPSSASASLPALPTS
jgi:hypothetical protein